MSTKHLPATPLPWRFEQHNGNRPSLYKGKPSYQPAYLYGDNESRICSFQHMPNDAAYIAHAANAYPRLVEALKAAADALWNYAANQRAREAESVLRELGEE